MSTTVHTHGTGSTPPAHQAKPKAQDKPAQDAAPGDLFASLLALIGQAPALADATTATATDNPTDLAQDNTGQDGASGTDPRGTLLFAGGPLALAGSALAATPGASALTTALAARPAEPGNTLEGFRAVEGHETLPTAALEAGLAGGTEPGKRAGPAPAFAWRNTPGAAQAAQTTATQFGTSQSPMAWQRVQAQAADTGLSLAGGLTAPRATVALDERFASQFHRAPDGLAPPWAGAAMGADEAAADATLGQAPANSAQRLGTDALGAAAPGTVVAGTGDAGGLGSSGDGQGAQSQASPDQGDGQNPATAGEEPTEIGHWGTGALRHASLRVGEDAATAIDIQLKVQGQQVDVNFTTDNPEARDALREQASAALGELLQQSGLGLGGVSVGTHGQSRDPSREQAQGSSTVQLGQARRNGQEAEGNVPARPRTDGSRPLDVFA